MRKGEQTRREIIRKAAPIFNQKGYDGAALSDLMRATGLEKGGIYRHFESKEELAGDAFDHAWKIAMDTRFQGTEAIPNTVDRLKQIVRNFRDRRTGLVPGGCPLLNTAIDCDDGQFRTAAVDQASKEHLTAHSDSSYPEGAFRMLEERFHLPLGKIKEFRLQMRPWTRIEFRNISLHCGQKTNFGVFVDGKPYEPKAG